MGQNKFIPWTAIKLSGGFWKKWQENIAENTSRAIYDRFSETGRIEAMKLEWKEGMPNRPHIYWDSDIAKWMEGSAYLLYLKDDQELRKRLESIIDYIEKGQTKDGYFNSAYLTFKPDKTFTDRTDHELYTAGHLIEAAVAHYYSTGSERFLKMMMKFADYIEERFCIKKNTAFKTPGHEEIELALVRLWEATGEERYLKLSKHFVDTRGTDKNERVFSVKNGTFPADPPLANQLYYNDTYAQDDRPAREMRKAGGHAVRAMYFYTAMADIAREYGDEALAEACVSLWDDSVNRKMYITGGVSAERYGEAIGTEYVLPNDYAYAETCASVAMANFSQRMFRLKPDGKYMDMIERQMYNGALSGLSMDGKGFFYDNALQCRPEVDDFFAGIHALPLLPPYRRQEVFECSCCPPNIYRFIAALGQYFYSSEDGRVYIHQYGESTAEVEVKGQKVHFRQQTDYPWDGKITITLEPETETELSVAVRIPGWCREGAELKKNGEAMDASNMRNGYIWLDGIWRPGDVIELDLPMEIVKIEGNPKIAETAGKTAIMRGPLVYCLEGTDNDFDIFDLTLGRMDECFTYEERRMQGYPIVVVKGKGMVHRDNSWGETLYRPYKADYKEAEFTAVPYFSWCNREVGDMTVWIRHEGG